MLKYHVITALENLAEARAKWAAANREFRENTDLIMKRLLNEAAVNMMSARDVSEFSGISIKRVRSLMRENNLNPKNGKRLLAESAAKTLAENAALMDKEPHEFDLMSPLAYLPMGSQMKRELTEAQTPSVTNVEPFRMTEAEWVDLVNVIGSREISRDVIPIVEKMLADRA